MIIHMVSVLTAGYKSYLYDKSCSAQSKWHKIECGLSSQSVTYFCFVFIGSFFVNGLRSAY